MSDTGARLPSRCWWCSGPMPEGSTRRARYCGARCRVAAHRSRAVMAPVGDGWEEAGMETVVAADPQTRHEDEVRALAGMLDGKPAGSPADQLLTAIMEAHALRVAFDRLADAVPPALAFRAAQVARDLRSTLARHFPIDGGPAA